MFTIKQNIKSPIKTTVISRENEDATLALVAWSFSIICNKMQSQNVKSQALNQDRNLFRFYKLI